VTLHDRKCIVDAGVVQLRSKSADMQVGRLLATMDLERVSKRERERDVSGALFSSDRLGFRSVHGLWSIGSIRGGFGTALTSSRRDEIGQDRPVSSISQHLSCWVFSLLSTGICATVRARLTTCLHSSRSLLELIRLDRTPAVRRPPLAIALSVIRRVARGSPPLPCNFVDATGTRMPSFLNKLRLL